MTVLKDHGPADYRWQHVTDTPGFTGRDGVGALVFHDRMFLLGGWNPTLPDYYPRSPTCHIRVRHLPFRV